MLAAAMLGCGFLGVAIERFAYRPLRNAPRIAPLISALGVSFLLRTRRCSSSAPTSAATTRYDLASASRHGIHVGAAARLARRGSW